MLYRRGRTWHYDFCVAGHRYRGSTRQTSETKARKIESMLMAQAAERRLPPGMRRTPRLLEFSTRFFQWVDTSSLEPNTKRYYANGWKRIENTRLAAMRLDHITTEDVDALQLGGSGPWINQSLRTLRRMLGKAIEWKLLVAAPRLRLAKEYGREQTIDAETEAKLIPHARQPLRDVLVIMQDCGARPEEVFRIRIEIINWSARTIFNPSGKTKKARRLLPISDRMLDVLMARCSGRKEGWLFPSERSKCGHLTTVAKQFREARDAAGLPKSLVLYCARHTSAQQPMRRPETWPR